MPVGFSEVHLHILQVDDLSTALVLACQLLTSVWLPWQGFQAMQRLCPLTFACQLLISVVAVAGLPSSV